MMACASTFSIELLFISTERFRMSGSFQATTYSLEAGSTYTRHLHRTPLAFHIILHHIHEHCIQLFTNDDIGICLQRGAWELGVFRLMGKRSHEEEKGGKW